MAGFNLKGAMSGLGGAMEQSGMEMLKANLDEQRQRRLMEVQALAAQQTHAVNAQTDIANIPARTGAETEALVKRGDALRPGLTEEARAKGDIQIDVARQSPRTIPPGSVERVGGETTYVAPERALPPEQAKYYEAAAARLNAEASAIANGMKYRDRSTPKPTLPEIKFTKDADGNITGMVDEKSGAVGRFIPGEAEKQETPGFFFGLTNWGAKPGSPATPAREEWRIGGRVLKNGLADIYPDLAARLGALPGNGPGGTTSGTDWSQFGVGSPAQPKAAPEQKAVPSVPSGPSGISSLLTPEDLTRINAQPSPAAKTQLRNEILRQRMQEANAEREAEGARAEEEYRSQGIDPSAPAFGLIERAIR